MKRSFIAALLLLPLLLSCGGKEGADPKPSKAKWVDMGTGVLWAVQNLGASAEHENGLKYAWASTKPGEFFTWGNCPFCNVDSDGNPVITGYGSDGKESLLRENDAATRKLKGMSRIPTPDEFHALFNSKVFEWVWVPEYRTEAGEVCYNEWNEPISGYRVTNLETGSKLFFPAAGIGSDNGGVYKPGILGAYWTDTRDHADETKATAFIFDDETHEIGLTGNWRNEGLSIRAVKPKE